MVDRAAFDQNNRNALIAVSNDGQRTPVELWADPITHALLASTVGGSIVTKAYDYITASYPDSVTEIYVFKIGGSGGTTVATVTVVYTDSTKDNLSTVTKT